jgi:hypothetical protein
MDFEPTAEAGQAKISLLLLWDQALSIGLLTVGFVSNCAVGGKTLG